MDVLKVDNKTRRYYFEAAIVYLTAKVETHNHPTAISPYEWAATGSGGEIRDEWAVWRGGKTAQGMAGYLVTDILFEDASWLGQNPSLATPKEIMLQAPLGSAHFNNAFGRPVLTGTFNAFLGKIGDRDLWFAKPGMVAGGIGMVEMRNAFKPQDPLPVWTRLVQIWGLGLRIGLGGASGSSIGLVGKWVDYSSVQRGNPEMQRRCQKVIDRLSQMKRNPILAIHDVGAGGIGNAFVELGEMGKKWARFDLDKALIGDPSLSAREIWSNESQERYVMALSPDDYQILVDICVQEGVPLALMWEITEWNNYQVTQGWVDLINVPFEDFFYKDSPIIDVKTRTDRGLQALALTRNIHESIMSVLRHPTVWGKQFLVTIWDQTVGGLTAQNQMAGPWRVPVTDVWVLRDGFHETTGNAMASGEALSLAPIDPAASVRMAITESLTNLLASDVSTIRNVIFSGNWMANLKDSLEFVDLYTAVKAAMEFAIALGIAIPTGKDSLSMQAKWDNILKGLRKNVSVWAPVVWFFTAFAPVLDASKTITPYLQPKENTELILIDLGHGRQRLGGSILAQVHRQIGDECPDIDANSVKNLYKAIIQLKREGKILAYHDRSAGGLMATLSEMAFASHSGLDIDISTISNTANDSDVLKALFNQEAWIVIQIKSDEIDEVMRVLSENWGNPWAQGISFFIWDIIWHPLHTPSEKVSFLSKNSLNCCRRGSESSILFAQPVPAPRVSS